MKTKENHSTMTRSDKLLELHSSHYYVRLLEFLTQKGVGFIFDECGVIVSIEDCEEVVSLIK